MNGFITAAKSLLDDIREFAKSPAASGFKCVFTGVAIAVMCISGDCRAPCPDTNEKRQW